VRLWNLYGPTETTIYCGGAPVGPAPEPIEVAPLIAGSELYVLDDAQRPVPPGVVGEVCVGGAGVAAGYRGAPGATAARFVPDPFGARPGARLYRTGDLGRWRPAPDRETGRIELLGRADRQLKIRGHRVESAEVEAALRTHPDVAEAVVALRGGGHDVRLAAYVVSRSGAGQPPPDLLDHVRALLPDYMVPSAVVVLPRLPLSPAGKTDHRALPEPRWGGGAPESIAPRTPVEAELAKIFADLLSLPEPPGVTDNFFALGGHSLTATRLMAEVRVRYGVDLPLRALFADPTVSGLATAVAAQAAGAGGAR
jgi:acyl-CoA synthetase (AMP-forming)/AMP-acid ligase II/acyl carrier protein